MTTASMGWAAQLGTVSETTYGVTPGGGVVERFVFVGESIANKARIVERQGLRGNRSHMADDSRRGVSLVAGSLSLEPTPADLSIWLPRILGAPASGSTFALASALPSFSLSVDRVAEVFTYAGCKVNRAKFSGAKGGLVRLDLEIVGQSESIAAAGSFPSLIASVESGPYIFAGDPVLTLGGAARERKNSNW